MPEFKIVSEFKPTGDQPKAINALVEGMKKKMRFQTLLGVTGSGKTYTVAHVIKGAQKPTLVIAPNKTLAAQLANELRTFLPENSVGYFVSYYDYYQPEAYVPSKDLYIEKDASINDEIDKLRHSATSSLLSRKDVVIVASVSCIYNLGSPEEYLSRVLLLKKGQEIETEKLLSKLVKLHYERNDYEFSRAKFRLRGDTIEVYLAYEDRAVRIELFGDEVEKITIVDPLTGQVLEEPEATAIYPASHFLTAEDNLDNAISSIEKELEERLKELESQNKLLEAQRLRMRTTYDLEMLKEVGFVGGIENYSRHLTGKLAGSPPDTLIDYFDDDFLLIIDESHITIPQLHGMYEGDRSRKKTLVEHGFRLPSAMDNRPLKFEEFEKKMKQAVFVSATPSSWELKNSEQVVEQIIRPTGLIDPEVVVKPIDGQIDDLLTLIQQRAGKKERVLVTTLTKKMAEDLTDYLLEAGVKARYMHSDIGTVERIEILRQLREAKFDVLVGINLLREGLDLPEVSLVAILDADKEGFLRSAQSLIQTIGRASRNVSGTVVMYADNVTRSMKTAINETNRRRKIQLEFNKAHGITPKTIRKKISDILAVTRKEAPKSKLKKAFEEVPEDEKQRIIQAMEEEMHAAAEELSFEDAARIRDELKSLKEQLFGKDSTLAGLKNK
ncbi:MAG: excinuclease ABC subunit UvrB [Actinobacteria bacterium]|nr:MAG: excinuclease ABC subunit UvrB [Actinomycetota bacterium]